jgi:anti-sigma factor RsiW
MTELRNIEDHVGELLSGYIDGELTQQDRQRVRLHCDTCGECQTRLTELAQLRERVGKAALSNWRHNAWRETMEDTSVKATRGIGWLLVIGGVLVAVGIAVFEILTGDWSMSLPEKLIVGGIYGGLLLLFVSVLRQRLIERKTDKYKDVEI